MALKTWKPVFFVTLCFLVAPQLSCYNKDFKEPAVKDTPEHKTKRAFRASYNNTWEAVLKSLGDAPIVSARKESGVIVTDWLVGKSDRIYSGYDETTIPYKVRYKMSIRIRPLKNGTEVDILNEEQYSSDSISQGGEFSGSLYNWVDTPSSTVKEKKLLDIIEENLQAAAQ